MTQAQPSSLGHRLKVQPRRLWRPHRPLLSPSPPPRPVALLPPQPRPWPSPLLRPGLPLPPQPPALLWRTRWLVLPRLPWPAAVWPPSPVQLLRHEPQPSPLPRLCVTSAALPLRPCARGQSVRPALPAPVPPPPPAASPALRWARSQAERLTHSGAACRQARPAPGPGPGPARTAAGQRTAAGPRTAAATGVLLPAAQQRRRRTGGASRS